MKPATSIVKVCRVLDAFRSRPSMGTRELAQATDLLPSDVHRILVSLAGFGYVEQDPLDKRYRLGLELLKLGHLVLQRLELRQVARPHLLQLSEAVQSTVNVAILDRRELQIIFVEQIDSPGEVQLTLRIGARASPHATSVGKVLCAWLDAATREALLKKDGMPKKTRKTITDRARLARELETVRARGYATDVEEAVEGACCAGAPLRDYTGEVVAAISVSMIAGRYYRFQQELIPRIKAAAARISAALGYTAERTAHAS